MFSFFRKEEKYNFILQDDELGLLLSDQSLKDDSLGITGGMYFDVFHLYSYKKIGYVSLRFGDSASLYYLGHIGYRIHERWRGNGYAGQACNCLLPLIKKMNFQSIVITTDPDNIPSQKTIEKIGCIYESTVDVPIKYRYICSDSKQKLRYIWLINDRV